MVWVGSGPNFSTCSGLGWVSQQMGWVGSGHTKWTHGQLTASRKTRWMINWRVGRRSSVASTINSVPRTTVASLRRVTMRQHDAAVKQRVARVHLRQLILVCNLLREADGRAEWLFNVPSRCETTVLAADWTGAKNGGRAQTGVTGGCCTNTFTTITALSQSSVILELSSVIQLSVVSIIFSHYSMQMMITWCAVVNLCRPIFPDNWSRPLQSVSLLYNLQKIISFWLISPWDPLLPPKPHWRTSVPETPDEPPFPYHGYPCG